jgi:hypothetical protein
MELKVYRLNSCACRIVPAEKTLNGTAHKQGVKWCHPFSTVNRLGWWIFPPCDFDVALTDKGFSHQLTENFRHDEVELVRNLIRPTDGVDPDMWCPRGQGRSKFTWGGVEPNVFQMWTGLIFQTPPGWGLHIRSPINFPQRSYHIMEGVLETDWMQYDIWMNVVVSRKNEVISFRRDQFPPMAQIIPIRRDTYEPWGLTVEQANRDTPDADRVFSFWAQYNQQKFGGNGKQKIAENRFKDSTTFFMNRKRILGEDGLPKQEEMSKCPHLGLAPNHRTEIKSAPVLYKRLIKVRKKDDQSG